jgi:prepilin-type N-terminal cleavage/methylation domain-containing protein
MITKNRNKRRAWLMKNKGFTLIEVIVGMALMGIALLGLAQLFMVSVMNNMRSDNITHATFLAQQKIDYLRNLTTTELSSISNPENELIDVNNDGTIDFRRITLIQPSGSSWDVKVLVFSPSEIEEASDALIQGPDQYRVKANMSTTIR